MKNRSLPVSALLCALFFAIVPCLFSSCSPTSDMNKMITKVGSVNGTEIMTTEIDYYIPQLRSNVISYFTKTYGAEYTDTFWQTDFDGITPEKYLFNEAFSKAADAKLKLLLCKEYGVYDNISFDALKAKAEKFNKDNEGKKTVGITSIDMNTFYDYYVSNGVLALQNTLVEKGEIEKTSDFDDLFAAKKAAAEIIQFQNNGN